MDTEAVTADTTAPAQHRGSPHLRGHFLLFDRKAAPPHSARAGVLLLVGAALVETARLAAVKWLYPGFPLWMLVPALLALGLLVPAVADLRRAQLGFRRWRDWTATEKSYFLQVVILANVIFPIVLGTRLAQPGMSLWTVFVPYLSFGFYQELVYRGLVQVELVRRWGAPVGIVAANALFTFGPLHWYYFASPGSVAVLMFASIFAIGLFFGILYRRSGNLWIVAIFHAIGNAYIVWSVGAGHR
jgi:membrane protease YdiL (CAAX protease family)